MDRNYIIYHKILVGSEVILNFNSILYYEILKLCKTRNMFFSFSELYSVRLHTEMYLTDDKFYIITSHNVYNMKMLILK